uniref:Uncharacterized protein n=1 Tax=Iridovirus LCIVAC01 TaxID=2506607 RepID=A0A481YR86_9VIRU|nr:MAG: hypothetical protein LCIVAC01_00440 [Iridovirus LCIVAC01]
MKRVFDARLELFTDFLVRRLSFAKFIKLKI